MEQLYGRERKEGGLPRLLAKKAVFAGSYFVAAAVIEAITFATLGFGFPAYWWLDFSVLLVLTVLVFAVPGFVAQAVVISALLLLQCAVAIANDTLYGMSNLIFTISLLNVAGEAAGVFQWNMLNFALIAGFLAVVAAEIAALVFAGRIRSEATLGLHTAVMLFFVYALAAVCGAGLYLLMLGTLAGADSDDPFYIYVDDGYLWETQFQSAKALEKFGMFAFYYKNIANYFSSGVSVDAEEAMLALDDYFGEGEWSSSLAPYEGYDQIMTGKFEGQNLVLIVIESGEWIGINKEYTPTLYAMASRGIAMTEYYARDKTNHSEALSILGSYPLESDVSDITDHFLPFTSANVLKSSGYTANYFHTNNGPYYNREITHDALYGFDHLFFMDTMDRLKGQYSKSDWYDFDRDSEVISQYLEDFTRVDEGDGAFFTMMMTLFTHGEYEDLVNYGDYTADLSEEQKAARKEKYIMKSLVDYYELIDGYASTFVNDKCEGYVADKYDTSGGIADTELYLRYKRYQAGMMDLDVGVNRLVHYLEEQGELDNTTFVFYADHNAYYENMQYSIKNISTSEYWNTELQNIPFFIWSGSCMDLTVENIYEGKEYVNPDDGVLFDSVYEGEFYYEIDHRTDDPIGGAVIEKYCNSFDVLPTILDLFGYDYNTNLYHGVSVFKEGTSVFISREAGIFNNNMYSDGEKLYVMAEESGDAIVSKDGEISYADGVFTVRADGQYTDISAAEAAGLEVYRGGDVYFVYTIASAGGVLCDSAVDFLLNVTAYYDKQSFLEMVYKYDYFSLRDFNDYLCRVE